MSAQKGDHIINLRIVVSGLQDRESPAEHVNDILQELTNRRDFRRGHIGRGVHLLHRTDYDRVQTSLEVEVTKPADPL